jgi:ABC-2 type transport system permease protein
MATSQPSVADMVPGRWDIRVGGLWTFPQDTWTLYVRQLKKLSRQPTVIGFALIQPVIWLGLFGQMFSRITQFPNVSQQIGSVSYLQFFIPTVMLQSVLFGAGQSGVGIIGDISSGYLDKLLTTPVSRGAILMGRLLGDLTRMMIQVGIVIVFGWAIGRFQDPRVVFANGIGGILAALLVVLLFGTMLIGFNIFIGLVTRNAEATFMIGNFTTIPLLFVSSAMLPLTLLPSWMRTIAKLNPVTYAIDAVRALLNGSGALNGRSTGEALLLAIVYLGILCAVTATLATRRFQRTVG